jgi:hypothetical protein
MVRDAPRTQVRRLPQFRLDPSFTEVTMISGISKEAICAVQAYHRGVLERQRRRLEAAADAAIRETNDPPLYGPAVAEVQAPASGVEWSETRPTASSP